MAETDVPVSNQPEKVESEEDRLKYLEFVQVAALHAVLYASKFYGYAKNNSGPLKPGVETIEGTLKTVVGPAYNKFHDVPVDVLKFVDRKVDESVNKFDSRVPPFVKNVSTEVKAAGVVETASGLAKTAYTRLEPVAEHYAVSAWNSLNRLPLFPKVANVVVPRAAYYSERYNQTVKQSAVKGYKVSSYLPLVPTEKIAKVPDVEGSNEDRCELTRTPYGRRFVNEELNSYMEFLFKLIVDRGPEVGLNVSLNRYDFFHGHLFIAANGRVGILFHAKEYPAYDKEVFPYNMGYCQKCSNVTYDDSMNLRNILWLAPLPSNSTRDWSAPGVLVVLDARPGGIIYRDIIPEYANYARTIYEEYFGETVVDVNYLNVGVAEPDYQIFIC